MQPLKMRITFQQINFIEICIWLITLLLKAYEPAIPENLMN